MYEFYAILFPTYAIIICVVIKVNIEINKLLNEKQELESKINKYVYGSVEIRTKDNKKYIYVHYRDNGRLINRYVDEYSDELYNLILQNNMVVSDLKKELRNINKRLKELNYEPHNLSKDILLNIDLAKKCLVDTIYDQAVLEGVATTFVQTEKILEGGKVNDMTTNDILKIVNLKHAWEFNLDDAIIDYPENIPFICQINKLVIENFYSTAGEIRSVPVKIGGTSWQPSIPFESKVLENLDKILNSDMSKLDIAIELLLYIMKQQIFIDGNKRTAIIVCNHYLIRNALGIISIPASCSDEYKKMLIDYYEGKNINVIKTFLKEKCYMPLR